MPWSAIGEIFLIALATLPIAGTPFALWLYMQYRRDTARQDERLHVVTP